MPDRWTIRHPPRAVCMRLFILGCPASQPRQPAALDDLDRELRVLNDGHKFGKNLMLAWLCNPDTELSADTKNG